MDLRLFARVLWRFKLIVGLGLVLALALAVFSMVKIGPNGLTYRQSELYSATTRLGVTQKGFPWGHLFAQEPTNSDTLTPGEQAAKVGIPVADPNRLNNIAVLYAELITSDAVRHRIARGGHIKGQIMATPLVQGDNKIMLPLIDVTAIADTPDAAKSLSLRTASAFQGYIREEQNANKVPDSDRIIVPAVALPSKASVFQPRSKTMAIVIFLAVMFGVVALAFLLENTRPRVRILREPAEHGESSFPEAAPGFSGRRTA
ncbi:MAG TPA: hypothetical protein VGF23_21000 [Gaiellaceae bacterium]|jgi:capsular polysaccharide biosynthesis protein